MAKASDNQFPYFHLVPGAAPSNPSAGERLYLDSGDGNKLKRRSTAGVVTTIESSGGGSGQGFKDFASAKRTAGNVTVNSTTFVNVQTGLDLVMTAAAGDVIEVGQSIRTYKTAAGSTYLVTDFHTIVAGSPVNSISSESAAGTGLTGGFPGWGTGTLNPNAAATPPFQTSGSKFYTLQSGDISSGTVTLRLRAFSGADVTFVASDPMAYVWAKNLGPAL